MLMRWMLVSLALAGGVWAEHGGTKAFEARNRELREAGGGQSTLAALLAHGDFYKAGVADCGCHDNRMDKTWWNEQWMDWPVGPHYAANSNVTHAAKLQGALLLTVGEVDSNVDPSSTLQVVIHLGSGGQGPLPTPPLERIFGQLFARHQTPLFRHKIKHRPRLQAETDPQRLRDRDLPFLRNDRFHTLELGFPTGIARGGWPKAAAPKPIALGIFSVQVAAPPRAAPPNTWPQS